ncbi:MAG: ZIP family metal transporter [Gammaproteobacteria bacterium]|nr:ZIP family metal transporter [Gammaproteobacteria bacterium]MBI5618376.1 ZIP family metal transporter [Gammaproteobacteria bacterium]
MTLPLDTLAWIMFYAFLGSVFSVAAAGGYLLLPAAWRVRTLSLLISFATGILLGVAFLHLLPEALEARKGETPDAILATVLIGIFVFFTLEKALIWRHAHDHGRQHSHAHTHHHHTDRSHAGALIMVGDTFHNFLDGVLLTAAFATKFELGMVTGLAIVAHEVPQELGDFAILIASGYSRAKAFALNLVSSMAMFVGALLAWWSLESLTPLLPFVIAFTASSFIYISIADLIPTLHRGVRIKETLGQLLLIGIGVSVIVVFHGD